jgi:ABC-type iron transport system FetAB ATPase subunit
LLLRDRESGLFDPGRQIGAPPSLHFNIAQTVGDLLFSRRSINARGCAQRLRVAFCDRRATLVGARVAADEGERQSAQSNRQTSRDRYRIDHADHPLLDRAQVQPPTSEISSAAARRASSP